MLRVGDEVIGNLPGPVLSLPQSVERNPPPTLAKTIAE